MTVISFGDTAERYLYISSAAVFVHFCFIKAYLSVTNYGRTNYNRKMYNIERAIRALEYDMIINMLADCAPTEGAKMTALSLMPTNNYSVVLSRQRRTADAKRLMDIKGMPSFGGVIDISASVERAEKGAVLTNAELLSCANVLRTARRLAGYISRIHLKRRLMNFLTFSP